MIDIDDAKRALPKIRPGLYSYLELMRMFPNVDVSVDTNFQKKFNGFYKMRQRPRSWYELYFDLMQTLRNEETSFGCILKVLHERSGRMEASFCSKMLATIDPSKPVIDRYVLENVGLKMPYYSSKNRFGKLLEIYDKLCAWYENVLRSDEGVSVIDMFDDMYGDQGITDLKKIDLVLWQIRA